MVAVALPTRIATTQIRICVTTMLSANFGPTQARIERPASRNSAAASGMTVTSESRVPWMKIDPQALRPLSRVAVDDDREEDAVELVGQPLKQLGEPLRDASRPPRRRRP